MVVGIVFIVFLTPVLITGLFIWYKLRKNRMLNETMLQLAEKGVVAAGRHAAGARLRAHGRRRDRDGRAHRAVVRAGQDAAQRRPPGRTCARASSCGASASSFIAYSMFDDRSPNWIGLVLLFLGIGYGVLWYFEDRQLGRAGQRSARTPPAGGA